MVNKVTRSAFAILSTNNGRVVGHQPKELVDLARKILNTSRKLFDLQRGE